MASICGNLTTRSELRPCFVGAKKIKALFHRWYEDPHAGLVGIVEYENGNVLKHTTKNIQFADSAGKFTEYSWGDELKEVMDNNIDMTSTIPGDLYSGSGTISAETIKEIRLRKAEVNDGK